MKHVWLTKNFIIFLGLLLLAGCTLPPSDNNEPLIQPEGFSDEQQYFSFIQSHQKSYTTGMLRADIAMPTMVMDTAIAITESAPQTSYTTTNVQVAGIDEGDIIKTNGEYIYIVTQQTLLIINAQSLSVTHNISLPFYARALFIDNNHIAVFGAKPYERFQTHEKSILHIYTWDDELHLENTWEFEGYIAHSRMMQGHIYIVTQTTPSITTLPGWRFNDQPMILPVANIRRLPLPYDGVQLMTIHAIDLFTADHQPIAFTTPNSHTMYMSHNNIYITATEYVNEYEIQMDILKQVIQPYLTAHDNDFISRVHAVDDDILSQRQKQALIMQTIEQRIYALDEALQDQIEQQATEMFKQKILQDPSMEKTHIIQFSINKNQLEKQHTFTVPGRLNNQFAMDESEDILRLATTTRTRIFTQQWPNFITDNNVFTIRDGQIIGSLTGLAETESIFATRFIGDLLYMVTFEEIDPFFVIDLSEPTRPTVLGELKIPGFSRYLHPYNQTVIIGVGRDIEPGTSNAKVSLFDVNDVTQPIELATWTSRYGFSSSMVEFEHKAFLFSPQHNIVVIPISSWNWRAQRDEQPFNGVKVLHVDGRSITHIGSITHDIGAPYVQGIQRSLIINNTLYTLSPNALLAHSIDKLEKRGSLII